MANSVTSIGLEASDHDLHEIRVSGSHYFPMNQWREAIIHFLFGIWGNKGYMMRRPEISFGNVTLALNSSTNQFYAFGVSPDSSSDSMFSDGGKSLRVTSAGLEVMNGLIRFVKDDYLYSLSICLPGNGVVRLWKTPQRGQYRCHAVGIPPYNTLGM